MSFEHEAPTILRAAFLSVLLCAIGFISTAACGEAKPKAPQDDEPPELPRAKLEDGVFLQSGDIKISMEDVNRVLLLMLTEEKKKNPKNVPAQDRVMRARIEIAQVLLQNAVIEKYARDHKLETTKEDLDKFVESKKKELQAQNSTFEQMLSDTGQTEAQFRSFWGAKIAIEKDVGLKLTDAELDEFFAKNKAELPLRSAAHILYQYKGADSAPRTTTRTKAEAQAAAEAALAELKAGRDFAALAAASEDDATKTNGGALPFFPLKGKESMVDSFGKAVYALEKIGDLTPVVETPFGFHVIKLTGIRDDEYKKKMRGYLAVQKFVELLRPVLLAAVDAAKFNEKLTDPAMSK